MSRYYLEHIAPTAKALETEKQFIARMDELRRRGGQKGAIAGMVDDLDTSMVGLRRYGGEDEEAIRDYMRRLRDSQFVDDSDV